MASLVGARDRNAEGTEGERTREMLLRREEIRQIEERGPPTKRAKKHGRPPGAEVNEETCIA
jgi:hypothetical protein